MVDLVISMNAGEKFIGTKQVTAYLPHLKEDLMAFINKMYEAWDKIGHDFPADSPEVRSTLTLDLVSIKLNEKPQTHDSDLFKLVQAMVFEL